MNYLQVLYKTPYVKKLDKWTIKIDLQTVKNFIQFESKRAYIFKSIDKLNQLEPTKKTDRIKVAYFVQLIKLIYEMSKKEYGLLNRGAYKKFLMNTFLDNINLLIDVYKEILDHNSFVEVKKKLQEMQVYDIWAVSASMTIGDDYYMRCIRTTENGRKYLVPASSLN